MGDYFCGWYFKCQSETQTLALIPAIHDHAASVQLITDAGSWNFPFSYEQFRKERGRFAIAVGENRFGEDGIALHLSSPDCSASGSVRFGAFSSLPYDIMGPFRYVPFMQCRHSVVSMGHTVTGELHINGTSFRFQDAHGYIEGDRGTSFPKTYAWTQCFFEEGSIMLSVADIPFGLFRFTGVIGVILWRGRQYRLATYWGARGVKIENGEIIIRQGRDRLTVRLIEKAARPLYAPVSGRMGRTIHESAACRAAYRFERNGQTLFSFESPAASFEYEYPR